MNETARPFVPTEKEVREARTVLAELGFPTELVLEILEFARYWPEVTHDSTSQMSLRDRDWSLNASSVSLYLEAHIPQEDPRFEDSKVKVKEIEFTIVSHDQGWTTEHSSRTYKTSSWFEASIFRSARPDRPKPFDSRWTDRYTNLESAIKNFQANDWSVVPRPSMETEHHRQHCEEMKYVTNPTHMRLMLDRRGDRVEEGKNSWWLQGNLVAKSTSVFEGEMVKRYRVVWGSSSNPRFEGNVGAGKGEGFVDSLQKGDIIAIWARVKRRGWENHVYGVRMTLRYSI